MDPPIERDDDLFWLRDDDRKDPSIVAHLEAENAYTEAHLAHAQPLAKKVYDEIVGSIQETDDDVPFPWGDKGHTYMVRTVKGKAYPIVVRTLNDKDWETVLDVNEVAAPLKYCSVGAFRPDPSHDILAYSIDPSGYETYEVRFKDLVTGEDLPDVIKGTAGGVSWGHCDASTGHREVYYSTQDDAHRPDKVWRHVIGTDQSADTCVLHEPDELFNVGFGRTSSGRFMLIESESTETNEVHYVDITAGPGANQSLVLMEPRRMGHRYYPEHRGDHWFILTNRDGKINFDLVRARLASPSSEHWEKVPGAPGGGGEGCDGVGGGDGRPFEWSQDRTLESICAFKDFLVLEGREGGFSAAWVLRLTEHPADSEIDEGTIDSHACIKSWHKTSWPSQNCCVYTSVASSNLSCVGANQVFDTDTVMFSYQSLTTPKTVYAYDMRTAKSKIVKSTPVRGYNADRYATTRMEVFVRDGTKVPVSIAWRKDAKTPKGPMLLSGYGSYGVSNDPTFSREDVPLMDRGVVMAVAHIRGGGEMGRHWYEKEGKYLTKKNTFNDFVDVAEHLVATGWTSTSKLAISGRSAGGLLMGNAVNMRPELFKCVVAAVPFVDMMVSMCDPSIPLTTGEWEEWGNPNEEKYYEYMLSYGPMENIKKGPKPEVLITAGLHDPRVAYWEAAKYAARLRAANETKESRILLKTDLAAGHFSASDRYQLYKERAYEHAFVLDSLGLSNAKPGWAK